MEDANLQDNIAETIINSIAKVKKISPDTIRLDSTFEDLKLDSLDGLDLFFELEEAFNLTIPDSQVRSLHNVGSVVEEIEKLLVEKDKAAIPN
jgi:acyl carrier protein